MGLAVSIREFVQVSVVPHVTVGVVAMDVRVTVRVMVSYVI